jgi:hypothetical protein
MAAEPGITRQGESLDNAVWDILGQTCKPVQLSEASFVPAEPARKPVIVVRQ